MIDLKLNVVIIKLNTSTCVPEHEHFRNITSKEKNDFMSTSRIINGHLNMLEKAVTYDLTWGGGAQVNCLV